MKKLKIGLIGVGNMGSVHVNSISELSNCVLTSICDINKEKLEKYRAGYACFDNSDDFFEKADIESVIIAVPHYFHVPLALRAIERGLHVIVEKPIAVQKSEAERLVKACAAHPELKVAAMFNQRTVGAHKKIRELIENGELGKIMRVNWIITDWFRSQNYYDSGDWRASWRGEGGGVLINQCPHQLDLMQWFFGLPSKVTAFMSFGKYHNIEVEDDVTAYLEYPNGATGVFIASTGEAPGTNRLEITAERGRLVFEGGAISFTRTEVSVPEFTRNIPSAFCVPPVWYVNIPTGTANNNPHRDIIENHANAVLNGTPLIAPAAEGIRGLELGNSMLLSHLTKKTISLPMDPAEFDDQLQKLAASSKYTKKTVASGKGNEGFLNSFGR